MIARSREVSNPEPVPSLSIEVTSNSPAPRSTRALAQATASEARRRAAAVDRYLPAAGSACPGIDGDDHGLPPEPTGAPADQRRVRDGRGVERDLVGTGTQDVAHLRDRPHPAADRQRDECPAGRPLDDVEESGPALRGRADVEEDELVGALGRIALGEGGRVALVNEVFEADALDDATVGHIEAWDHAPAKHQAARTRSTKLASRRRPSRPLRSG